MHRLPCPRDWYSGNDGIHQYPPSISDSKGQTQYFKMVAFLLTDILISKTRYMLTYRDDQYVVSFAFKSVSTCETAQRYSWKYDRGVPTGRAATFQCREFWVRISSMEEKHTFEDSGDKISANTNLFFYRWRPPSDRHWCWYPAGRGPFTGQWRWLLPHSRADRTGLHCHLSAIKQSFEWSCFLSLI